MPIQTSSSSAVEEMETGQNLPPQNMGISISSSNPNLSVAAPSPLSHPLLSAGEEDIREKRQKVTLVVFASFSIFLFAGSFYGWGPMQLLLEQNGNFGTECSVEEMEMVDGVCPEQTAALLNCRFVSQMTVLTGPLLGYLSDRYGGTTLTYCMGVSIVSGLTLLMVAVQFPGTVWDSMLYVAFVLMGLGATSGGLLTVETGLVFRDRDGGPASKAQSRVISLLNALFDAGATTYLGLWGLEKVTSNDSSTNVNLMAILGSYLGLAILFLAGYVWSFRLVFQNDSIQEARGEEDDKTIRNQINGGDAEEGKMMDRTERTTPSRLSSTVHQPMEIDGSGGDEKSAPTSFHEKININQQISRLSSPCDDMEDDDLGNDANEAQDDSMPLNDVLQNSSVGDASYIPISRRSVVKQLRSQSYILLCLLFSFHMVSNVWTLTTARDFLKYLGDDDYGNRYLSIFTLMTPVSLAALPFEDFAIHKFGFAKALQAVNFLGMLHGIVRVASTNLNVQIVGFVIFSFYRCFLFAVTFSCLASFTSSHATGRAVGIMYVVSGAASFINIGLANLAVERMNGDFFIPNMLFVVLTVPMVYVVYVIGKALERDDFYKAQAESQSLVTPETAKTRQEQNAGTD
jgi:Major Facilitator Superfamily